MSVARVAGLLILITMFSCTVAFAINCTISTAGFSFGIYDPLSTTPLDSAASISVSCNNPVKGPKKQPVPVTLTLSPGNSGAFAARYMSPISGGPDRLYYNLSTSPSHATVFGDGTGGSDMVTALVSKEAPLNTKIYGRIPAQQKVVAGNYSDLITVTVTW